MAARVVSVSRRADTVFDDGTELLCLRRRDAGMGMAGVRLGRGLLQAEGAGRDGLSASQRHGGRTVLTRFRTARGVLSPSSHALRSKVDPGHGSRTVIDRIGFVPRTRADGAPHKPEVTCAMTADKPAG
jgi:hypothetical protein